MSLKTLERAIFAEAKIVFCNPKLKLKDIAEWSTGDVKAQQGETVAMLPALGINVAIPSTCDKRTKP